MKEPGLEKLALYRIGGLPEEEVREIEKHLESDCRVCKQTMDWLALIQDSAAAQVRRPVPEHLQEMAQRIFRQYQAGARKARPGKAWAVCILDSLWRPLPAGVRPAVVDTRRLLYVTDGYEIDIETNPASSGHYSLLGHITRAGKPVQAAPVTTIIGRKKRQAQTDDLGVFSFHDLPLGEISLTITSGEDTVEVPQIPVGL